MNTPDLSLMVRQFARFFASIFAEEVRLALREQQFSGTDEPKLLTVKEAAAFLRIDETSLYRWVREGKIPSRNAGGRVVFLRSEILDWTLTDGDEERASRPAPLAIRRRR